MSALTVINSEMDSWATIRQQAEVLVKTGFLPQSIKTPEQAMAIILTGRELGIGAMQALNTINVIQGKPTISPQLMLALINRSGQLEDMAIDVSKDGAKCCMKRKGKAPYVARFGPTEAKAMGLDAKDNYRKQPATMYKWRAVADAARVVFPDVILGLYLPDEMGAAVEPESGEVVEMPAEATRVPKNLDEITVQEVFEIEEVLQKQEPVRTVKLEGAQPTDAQSGELPTNLKGQAGQVVALAKALKYADFDLAELVQELFGTIVMPGKLSDTLEFMTGDEHRELIRVLKGKLGGRP